MSEKNGYVPYREKLKDPRLQQRRLQILKAADFTCEDCGDKGTELHVHHSHYLRGREPWEYSGNILICVCKDCHKLREEWEEIAHRNLAMLLRWCTCEGVQGLANFLNNMSTNHKRFKPYKPIEEEV